MTLTSFINPELPTHSEEERHRIIVFRRYLIIMFVIFTLCLLLELTINFETFGAGTFLSVQLICAFFFCLSILKVPHKVILTLNILSILALNQFTLLSNPKSFHVLIYWIGLTPLFVAILTGVTETIFWTIVTAFFIILNGLNINSTVGSYQLTLDPNRFLAGGLIFILATSMLATLFSITQKKIREKLYKQNLQLTDLSDEIGQHNAQLKNYNDHLEERVHERTEELEHQNKQLTEYAYINSHLLRGPLARILGIIDLLSRTQSTPEQQKYLEHLNAAASELDDVITKINKALGDEGKFSRETIQQLKDKN